MSVPKFTSALGIQFVLQHEKEKPHIALLMVEDRESSQKAYNYLFEHYPSGTIYLDLKESKVNSLLLKIVEKESGNVVSNMELAYNKEQLAGFLNHLPEDGAFAFIAALYTNIDTPLQLLLPEGGGNVLTLTGYKYTPQAQA